ncbi:unnamed protein product [Amoebophrya sp. A120]|nr:unnamed protein product [Amoebophrya sp. A120]|eukprot:GSA120T00004140001.1
MLHFLPVKMKQAINITVLFALVIYTTTFQDGLFVSAYGYRSLVSAGAASSTKREKRTLKISKQQEDDAGTTQLSTTTPVSGTTTETNGGCTDCYGRDCGADIGSRKVEQDDPELGEMEEELVKRINEYREASGLPPAKWDVDLAAYARGWSHDQARMGLLSHDYFQERAQAYEQEMLTKHNLKRWMMAENCAQNTSANGAFESWKTSQGHNANMLAEGANYIVVGIARDVERGTNALYFTQLNAGDV